MLSPASGAFTRSLASRAWLGGCPLCGLLSWLVQTLVQSFSITPAHYESSAVAHDDNVLAFRPGLHFFDAIEINDGRAMYAHKLVRTKLRFHSVHRFAHQVRITAHLQAHVIPDGAHPVNFFDS